MEKLYLLDAYALIYRAYYALMRSNLKNPTIYGFTNTLQEVLKKKPDYLAVAFDPSGPTFRHEAFPAYKAQREETPEDIKHSVPYIKKIIEAYRIPILEVKGFEADDVIGTVAKRMAREGLEVCMLTPDKDYAQLVGPGIKMCRPGHGTSPMEVLGEKEVCEKYSLSSPTQVIDLLGLMGDTADNFPGCPGVGEKTAQKLIAEFGSIDNLLANTDKLKGALKKKVEENVESIRQSQFLATIKTDVPIDVSLDKLRVNDADTSELRKLFTELEFRTLLKKLDANGAQTVKKDVIQGSLFDEFPSDGQEKLLQSNLASIENTHHEYHLIKTEEEARELCTKLLTSQTVAIDTETTSLDALTAHLVGMSFAAEEGKAYYVAVPRETPDAVKMAGTFSPLFESPTILKVGQNLKYDLSVLQNYGVRIAPPIYDTMLAHYVVQPELRHNMDILAETYLHYRTVHIDELIGAKWKGQKNMADLAPEQICDYAAEDADVTLRLKKPLDAEMAKYGVEDVFRKIEMPLMPVLAKMERNGVRIDTAALAETGRHFTERMNEIEQKIFALAGHEFLINSPRQVGTVLFEELKLSDKARKTKSGQYSTGEEVLEALRSKHPIAGLILDYRGLKKLLSTYIEALPKLINPTTGHIHTSFNQAVTATGRLSSSNPNLQNIPVRGEDGREIRKAFVPEEGEIFFSADYSQIELRLMAHLSGDEHLINDFKEGKDIHAATAARIFKKPIEEISKDERRKAKTANFGIIYGISAFGLAERMEVSRTEAKELIDSYFETYPGVVAYIEQCKKTAREKGYVETLFHRRRYLPDINSRNGVTRGYAERNAVNAPIQGTAADIIKIAMIRIDRRMVEEGLRAKMILQVHDELNFSVSPEELPRLQQLVVEEMEHAVELKVPLLADCGTGSNWLEAH